MAITWVNNITEFVSYSCWIYTSIHTLDFKLLCPSVGTSTKLSSFDCGHSLRLGEGKIPTIMEWRPPADDSWQIHQCHWCRQAWFAKGTGHNRGNIYYMYYYVQHQLILSRLSSSLWNIYFLFPHLSLFLVHPFLCHILILCHLLFHAFITLSPLYCVHNPSVLHALSSPQIHFSRYLWSTVWYCTVIQK